MSTLTRGLMAAPVTEEFRKLTYLSTVVRGVYSHDDLRGEVTLTRDTDGPYKAKVISLDRIEHDMADEECLHGPA